MRKHFVRKKIECRLISSLKPHSRQKEFYGDLSRAALEELAKSMKQNGLICPVEITAAGVIICGHQRVAAALLLGWKKIACWVRCDLEAKGEDAVFRRMIEDNRDRRQLSKFGLGRLYLELKKKEYDGWRADEQARGDFRDYIGEMLKVDGSTAERWAKLSALPIEYDALIDSGLLTQQQALKVVKCLPKDIWKKLGQDLCAIANLDLERKEKKHKIRMATEAQVGQPRKVVRPKEVDWTDQLRKTIDKMTSIVPGPVVDVATQLSKVCGDKVVVKALKRNFGSDLADFNGLKVELDAQRGEALRHGALLMLSLLMAAELHTDSQRQRQAE